MELDEAKARVRRTYNLAADHFDDAALSFWARAGARTIELTGLAPGNRVLDVCCGSGATAIPAAQAVGRFGTVLGVDLADGLLELGRVKAAALGLTNIEFRAADVETMRFPEGSCDAVVCQFGIFFLTDMEAATRRLWSLVAPGGALAITSWGQRVLEPAMSIFLELVAAERPDLKERSRRPWDRISTAEQLKSLYLDAGVPEPEVVADEGIHALAAPTDFWTIMAGSGSRGTISALGEPGAARVRDKLLRRLEEEAIRGVETNVLYAVARRPK